MPKPLLCNPKPFKDQFRRDTKERKERRYCFILGAGASVSSGIPSGKTLAEQWLRELYDRQCPAPDLGKKPITQEEWCAHPDCPVPGIDPKNPGTHYPQLFLARFPGGDPEGQRFIQEAIRGAVSDRPNVPSVGYAYLALILQQTESRVVITTNFDNLAADALLLFTGSLPRVVGHERVASFAGLRDGQPLIAKIHGDVGFVTANDPEGVFKLHDEWTAPLREIFRDHIPVFIGYDGNDGSLMDFLCEKLSEPGTPPRSLLRSGLYWCYRAGEGRDWQTRMAENARLKKLTEAHQVHFVPIGDFDLWLMELGITCDVGDPEQILQGNLERRVKTLAEQISRARGDQAVPAATPAVEASRAATREEIGRKLSQWDWVYRAIEEKDPDKAESHYREAVAIAPTDPGILGSYASFLRNVRNDHHRAQDLYEQALRADPDDSANLGNYANFLTDIRKDHDRAQELYERALRADPDDSANLGNYANFLTDVRKDRDRAQELYERVLKADPNHAIHLGNYASFLWQVRKDYDRAQVLYERALKAEPNHANNLHSYASFLWQVRKDLDRAQGLYERALKVEPNHANHLGNYASFLWQVRKDHDRAQALYERALKADPNYVNHLGNYAGFLQQVRKDYDRAQALYERALKVEPNHVNNLQSYASFLWQVRKDLDRAQGLYERALEINPKHAHTLGNYSGFLLANGRDSEGLPLLDRAIAAASPESPAGLDVELWFYAFAHRPAVQREEALSILKSLLIEKCSRSAGWDLSQNINRAVDAAHPEAAWLPKLAEVVNGTAELSVLDSWPAWAKANGSKD